MCVRMVGLPGGDGGRKRRRQREDVDVEVEVEVPCERDFLPTFFPRLRHGYSIVGRERERERERERLQVDRREGGIMH
jgi:hypothetical protein